MTVHTAEPLVGLLAVVALLGVVAERARLPYPAVLVLGGIVLGLLPGLPRVRLHPEVVLLGVIPVLVYAGAFNAASYDLRRHARQIVSLATGFVLLTVVATGAVAHLVGGIGWAPSFVAGALAAPTDPVSAGAVLSHVGAPEQVMAVLEGESLINDGTGLAVYQVAVAAVGGSVSLAQAVLKLLEVSAGGIAIGLLAGWLAVRIRRPLDTPTIEIVLGLLTAYGSYIASLSVGFSGVLAAVAAGLYAGWHGIDISSPQARLRMEPVWDAATFVLQSLLFLLVGLQLRAIVGGISARTTGAALLTTGLVVLVVIVLRFGWMLAVSPLLTRRLRHRGAAPQPWRELVVLGWSGMRGALSLAGALAIPLSAGGGAFPQRDEVIFLVYGVVLGTLIVPSLTLETLIRRLGLGQADQLREEEIEARMRVAHAALAWLDEAAEREDATEEVLSRLRGIYELRLRRLASEQSPEERADHRAGQEAPVPSLRRELVGAQRRALSEIRQERATSSEVIARIQHDIDVEEMQASRVLRDRPSA